MSSVVSQFLSESLGLMDAAAVITNQKSALVLVAVLVVSIGVYLTMTAKSTSKTNKTTRTTTTDQPMFTPAGPAPANDCWEERRRRGIAATNNTNSTKTKEAAQVAEKPFGSSYYYAHNSVNAKGGYSDGLRMEDFTMNGPRLLSKNGMTVSSSVSQEEQKQPENPASSTEQPTAETPIKIPETSSTLITKYLWDDPGDASGIATIRIDTLPGPSGSSSNNSNTLAWKDAKIINVAATLKGEGLLVICTDENQHEYRLQINRLYDKAAEVRTVVKAKRLLVKIHKRRGGHLTFLGKSNLEAWPHPQRK